MGSSRHVLARPRWRSVWCAVAALAIAERMETKVLPFFSTHLSFSVPRR